MITSSVVDTETGELIPAVLNTDERAALADNEARIERGLKVFYEVGAALLDIRDKRLYRETHKTFEDYCQQRWGMTPQHAGRLITAADITKNLEPIGSIPANEGQARPLAPLSPEEQRAVWDVVRKTAPDGKVTAGHVKSVVSVFRDVVRTGAIDNGEGHDIAVADVVTAAITEETYERMMRQQSAIREKTVHVSHNSGENEWYTPADYTAAARAVMGAIDLDPASSEVANQLVCAARFFTAADDGLAQDWHGRVWMNPPYAQPLVARFCDKLADAVRRGHVSQACVLVNNATETAWFQTLLDVAAAVCFIKGRVKFLDSQLNPNGAPLQGQALLYIGPNVTAFRAAAASFGKVLYV